MKFLYKPWFEENWSFNKFNDVLRKCRQGNSINMNTLIEAMLADDSIEFKAMDTSAKDFEAFSEHKAQELMRQERKILIDQCTHEYEQLYKKLKNQVEETKAANVNVLRAERETRKGEIKLQQFKDSMLLMLKELYDCLDDITIFKFDKTVEACLNLIKTYRDKIDA